MISWYVFFIPCIILLSIFIINKVVIILNDSEDPLEYLAQRGMTQTILSEKEVGLVCVNDKGYCQKYLKCKTYNGTLFSNSKVVIIEYIKEESTYMVEPYV